ncbi:hypothetical protein ABEDC_3185 [Acinetobacter lwoffii]|nr:hypothetical protein ABEDC_3185 [Acinetobacter lwoffii]
MYSHLIFFKAQRCLGFFISLAEIFIRKSRCFSSFQTA